MATTETYNDPVCCRSHGSRSSSHIRAENFRRIDPGDARPGDREDGNVNVHEGNDGLGGSRYGKIEISFPRERVVDRASWYRRRVSSRRESANQEVKYDIDDRSNSPAVFITTPMIIIAIPMPIPPMIIGFLLPQVSE